MNEIGQRMRELRENAGLTQAEIAKLCGTNQTTITRMEIGKTVPSIKILVWWADYFDVSMDYLCCRTDNPQGATYEARPKVKISNDMKRFIEMCFDPKSPASKQLKKVLIQTMEASLE